MWRDEAVAAICPRLSRMVFVMVSRTSIFHSMKAPRPPPLAPRGWAREQACALVTPARLARSVGGAGVGGVGGSFYVAWRGGNDRRLKLMMVSMVAFGALLMFFSLSPFFIPAVVFIFSANIFASIFQTLNNTAIQLLISDDVRGRISSFLMMSFSLPLLGTLPLSAVAERVGAPAAVGGASVLAVVVALLFYLFSPALRELDERVRSASSES